MLRDGGYGNELTCRRYPMSYCIYLTDPPFVHAELLLSNHLVGKPGWSRFTMSSTEGILFGDNRERQYAAKRYMIHPIECTVDQATTIFETCEYFRDKFSHPRAYTVSDILIHIVSRLTCSCIINPPSLISPYSQLDIIRAGLCFKTNGYIPAPSPPNILTTETWFCSQMICCILQHAGVVDKRVNPSETSANQLFFITPEAKNMGAPPPIPLGDGIKRASILFRRTFKQ